MIICSGSQKWCYGYGTTSTRTKTPKPIRRRFALLSIATGASERSAKELAFRLPALTRFPFPVKLHSFGQPGIG